MSATPTYTLVIEVLQPADAYPVFRRVLPEATSEAQAEQIYQEAVAFEMKHYQAELPCPTRREFEITLLLGETVVDYFGWDHDTAYPDAPETTSA